jgi:hypothetical protein
MHQYQFILRHMKKGAQRLVSASLPKKEIYLLVACFCMRLSSEKKKKKKENTISHSQAARIPRMRTLAQHMSHMNMC